MERLERDGRERDGEIERRDRRDSTDRRDRPYGDSRSSSFSYESKGIIDKMEIETNRKRRIPTDTFSSPSKKYKKNWEDIENMKSIERQQPPQKTETEEGELVEGQEDIEPEEVIVPSNNKIDWEEEEEEKPHKKSRWEDEEEKEKEIVETEKIEKTEVTILVSPPASSNESVLPISSEEIPPVSTTQPTEPKKTIPTEIPKPKREALVKEEASLLFQAGLHTCRSVGIFEKICRIGDGAYGVVYKAKDRKTGEFVALKKVKMEKEKEGFPLTSIREIRILMSCKHQNIVSVKEIVVGKEIDSIFIAMEYLEHDLKTLLEDMPKPFTISEVKCILNQLLLGVEYLHDNWILHRDIKTSNLLLNNNGIMKIADFGLARPYGSPLRPYTHVVVTLWYRAPELLLGTKTYTPAIDIWSVGCVFAELLLGKSLFKGKGEIDQLDQIFRILGSVNEDDWPAYRNLPNTKKFVNLPRKNTSALRQSFPVSRLSDKGLDLLQQMLTYNPEKRITAKEAVQHPYFEEIPVQKDTELMPTWPSRADGRRPRNTDRIVSPFPIK
jgi:serine/threonine protein kinase